LTRRANHWHDSIIAARVIGRGLVKLIEPGAIQHRRQGDRAKPVHALRKDVSAGSKRKMRRFGQVDIPPEALIAARKAYR